ncbi:MAG: hypothetical protein U1F67_06930 [Rubrivivax sp.]
MLGAWRWRSPGLDWSQLPGIARQWAWFMWPGWLLALWTLWRWRRRLLHRHLGAAGGGCSLRSAQASPWAARTAP